MTHKLKDILVFSGFGYDKSWYEQSNIDFCLNIGFHFSEREPKSKTVNSHGKCRFHFSQNCQFKKIQFSPSLPALGIVKRNWSTHCVALLLKDFPPLLSYPVQQCQVPTTAPWPSKTIVFYLNSVPLHEFKVPAGYKPIRSISLIACLPPSFEQCVLFSFYVLLLYSVQIHCCYGQNGQPNTASQPLPEPELYSLIFMLTSQFRRSINLYPKHD